MEVKKSFYTAFRHSFELRHMEEVVCNLCHGDRYSLLGRELQFEIRKCTDCGLVYVSPQPAAEELPLFYEGMYPDASADMVKTRSAGFVEPHVRRILLRRRSQCRDLLEIGCGYGRLLRYLSDLPCRLTAIEMSKTAADYARQHVTGADIRHCSIEAAAFPHSSFDCALMVAVLEHVKDPRGTLAKVSAWLRTTGLILIQVPYMATYLQLKRFMPYLPIHFEAPRHLFDFSPSVLRRYLLEAGFIDVIVEIARPYSSPSRLGLGLIWAVKLAGLAIYGLTAKKYIYPFAGGIVAHGVKR